MLYTNQMIDLDMDQQNHGYLLPEPDIVLGTITSFQQSDIPRLVPGSQTDSHHLTDCYASPMCYQLPQYAVGHHHPAANFDQGAAMASNFYTPSLNPSPGIPLHHGSSDQLPSASGYGAVGVPVDEYEYGRNNHFVDDIRCSYKIKNTEGIPGNFQHINASASSSSSVAPLTTRHPEGVAAVDAASFVHPQVRGNGIQPIREVGSHRCVRNRLDANGLDPVLAHNHNHYMQGNYLGQPFQSSSSLWLDQCLSNNCSDVGVSRWNQPPFMTYTQGNNVNGGSLDTGSMGLSHYHGSFLQFSPADLRQNNFHHLSPSPVQLLRGQNVSLHPQVAAPRVPLNYASHSSINLPRESMRNSFRHPGPVPPMGIRIVPEISSRRHNLPYLRFLPTEGVAMLEIADIYADHHRDMRLDIEDMSYEELLALGEQIGNVSTGLSEEIIIHQLKTRTYLSSTSVNVEETACVDQEPDSCIICQEDYKRREKIGTLGCGHEYHAHCLKKWLLVKNVCPICKFEALITDGHNV